MARSVRPLDAAFVSTFDRRLTDEQSEGRAMATERHLDVLHEVFDAFNRHDVNGIMSYFADDCVFESPRGPDSWGSRFVGKDEVRRGLRARFEGIPDVRYRDGDHFSCGRAARPSGPSAGQRSTVTASRSAAATCGRSASTVGSSARTASGRSARREIRARRSRSAHSRSRCDAGPIAATIRPSRRDDGASLRAIERLAGARVKEVGLSHVADHEPISIDALARYSDA
jgi:hypothetical protein